MGLFVFCAAWFIAGFVNHVVGLGAAMVAMPIAVHFMPLNLAVPSSTLIVLVLNMQLAWTYRQSIRWEHLLYVLMGGMVGAIGGIALVTSFHDESLERLMGMFLIAYAVYSLFFEKKEPQGVYPVWGIPTGICSTFLGTAFGFNGPPLAIFATLSGWSADEAKGFLGASFIITCSAIITGQTLAGLQTGQTLLNFALACPASLVGGLMGIRFSRRFFRTSNRKLLLGVLLFAGISLVMPLSKELFQ
ncbi:sulfite exporter TauE/SafE family protein [Desulfoplanes formicivorans]|uniref:Probable membrane transporter protein n=1 Tax=Desulfoplanes formicivorans TaxID=1592317 RepID=A0A194AHE7_9BACT|nr:sulfite exporter TauE/SafE family protein [Desulfoplanes formicivorans]GAU08511.1 hypothetical protein DPF_1221 [Desulfoplanes formicivorans]